MSGLSGLSGSRVYATDPRGDYHGAFYVGKGELRPNQFKDEKEAINWLKKIISIIDRCSTEDERESWVEFLNRENHLGENYAMIAIKAKYDTFASLLVALPFFEVGMGNNDGQTVLYYALVYSAHKTIASLLKRNPKIMSEKLARYIDRTYWLNILIENDDIELATFILFQVSVPPVFHVLGLHKNEDICINNHPIEMVEDRFDKSGSRYAQWMNLLLINLHKIELDFSDTDEIIRLSSIPIVAIGICVCSDEGFRRLVKYLSKKLSRYPVIKNFASLSVDDKPIDPLVLKNLTDEKYKILRGCWLPIPAGKMNEIATARRDLYVEGEDVSCYPPVVKPGVGSSRVQDYVTAFKSQIAMGIAPTKLMCLAHSRAKSAFNRIESYFEVEEAIRNFKATEMFRLDGYDRTIFHHAALNPDSRIMLYLLDCLNDETSLLLSLKNNESKLAIEIAAENGCYDTYCVIKDACLEYKLKTPVVRFDSFLAPFFAALGRSDQSEGASVEGYDEEASAGAGVH